MLAALIRIKRGQRSSGWAKVIDIWRGTIPDALPSTGKRSRSCGTKAARDRNWGSLWAAVMNLVLDSSVALAWVYAHETTDAVLGFFAEIRIHGAWAPGLWRWEIANVLRLNVRPQPHHAAFRDSPT